MGNRLRFNPGPFIPSLSRDEATLILSLSKDAATLIPSLSKDAAALILSLSKDAATLILSLSKDEAVSLAPQAPLRFSQASVILHTGANWSVSISRSMPRHRFSSQSLSRRERPMPGYFGTEAQMRLQAQAEASVEFTNKTPGACQAGRFMGCDDPDRLGWGRIDQFLDRDGVVGFRLIPTGRVDELRAYLMKRNYRFDSWDVFIADRATALAASEPLLSRPLREGLTVKQKPTEPESSYVKRIQAFMAASGIVPFSGSLLSGLIGPASTLVVGDEKGDIAAAAHTYLPHNEYSAYRRYAWGGLVAVAEPQRGKGLGNFINAQMIFSAFQDLGATHIYELVSATNAPSRRMVEACGLRLEPSLVCGIATSNDGGRFTR